MIYCTLWLLISVWITWAPSHEINLAVGHDLFRIEKENALHSLECQNSTNLTHICCPITVTRFHVIRSCSNKVEGQVIILTKDAALWLLVLSTRFTAYQDNFLVKNFKLHSRKVSFCRHGPYGYGLGGINSGGNQRIRRRAWALSN